MLKKYSLLKSKCIKLCLGFDPRHHISSNESRKNNLTFNKSRTKNYNKHFQVLKDNYTILCK